VQRASGISCSLRYQRERSIQQLGRNVPRDREAVADAFDRTIFPVVIVREGGRSSIPETPAMESRSRGVLEAPHARGMTALCGPFYQRHCEEQSDEAIHSFFARRDGLLRFARNDGSSLGRREIFDPTARPKNSFRHHDKLLTETAPKTSRNSANDDAGSIGQPRCSNTGG
jgi:hypothetical protein